MDDYEDYEEYEDEFEDEFEYYGDEDPREEEYGEERLPASRFRISFRLVSGFLFAAILVVCLGIVLALADALPGTSEDDGSDEELSSEEAVTETTEETAAVSEEIESGEESAEEEEESVDLSDIETVLADLGIAAQFDGTLIDVDWVLQEITEAGVTDVTSESTEDDIYRYYQLYGRGEGMTAYDASSLDETTLNKLTAYEELLREELVEANDEAWLTVTADIHDTEEVTVWNSDYEISEESLAALEQALALFEEDGYEIGFVILDLTSGEAVSYCAGIQAYSASVIKAPYIFSLLAAGYEPTEDMYLAGNQSDNEAYVSLRETYGSAVFVNWLDGTGIPTSQVGHYYITTTPLDLARMFYKAVDLLLGEETYSDWARSTFTDSLNSAAALTIGTSKTVYSKAGWISETDGYHSYTNAAIVDGDRPYIVTMMSDSLGYVGLEYAQILMPVLDQIHEEMCGETADYGSMDFTVGEFSDSPGEENWSDGAPGMGEEGTPDYVAPQENAGAGSDQGQQGAGAGTEPGQQGEGTAPEQGQGLDQQGTGAEGGGGAQPQP